MSEDIGNKIKELRKKNGQTLEDIATIVGVGKSTVAKWENGRIANMRRDKIDKLARALRTSPTSLMGWDNKNDVPMERKKVDNNVDLDNVLPVNDIVQIPVLGEVAAGTPIFATENYIDYEYISTELASQGSFFALRIKGDSMYPRISEGDIVIVRKQSYADNGDIVIVIINGDSATCKKFVGNADGITLIPLNPAYEPMIFSNEDIIDLPVIILGKVVENRQKY